MVDKIKKIKSEVKGLYIRNNGYYLERMINKERLRHRVGRVGFFSADAKEDLRKAETIARELIVKVTDHGLASIKGLGATPILTQHTKGKTVAEVLEDFIAHALKYGTAKTQGRPLSASSVRRYKYLTKHAWKPLMDLPIASISKELLKKWYMDLVDESLKNDWNSRHNEALRNLSRLFTWAVNKEWLENNVANNLYLSETKQPSREGKPDEDKRFDLKTNEIGRFIYSLLHTSNRTDKQNSETSRDLILTYILTGGRQSEIKKMQWSWFADKTSEDAFNSFISPPEYTKTSKPYFYPCCVLLKELFAKRYRNREALAEQSKGDSALQYVFPDRLGRKHLEDARGRIDIVGSDALIEKRIGYHMFRFTFQDILQQCTEDNDLRIRAMHHTNKNLTHGTYGSKDINDDRLRGLFQDVEDYLSETLPLTVFSNSGEKVILDGTKKLGKDNRTEIDNRTKDKTALRDIVFGRRKAKYIATNIPEIQKINLEFLRKKFPSVPDNYFELWDGFASRFESTKQLVLKTYAILDEVKPLMGLSKDSKIALEDIAKFQDAGKLDKLKQLRRDYNIHTGKAKTEVKNLLEIYKVQRYLRQYISKEFMKVAYRITGQDKLYTAEQLVAMFNVDVKLEEMQALTILMEKKIIDKSNPEMINVLNTYKKATENLHKNLLVGSTLLQTLELVSVHNPILDNYYIKLKEQYKDTKDNNKIIWLRNVRTSVDASNDLPASLEVK